MRHKSPVDPEERDAEFADLLIQLGLKKNIAKVLVFLSHSSEASSREIERNTDLRQPEVSIAMTAMADLGWVDSRDSRTEMKGRPVKMYRLIHPIADIMDRIEREKRREAELQLQLIKKLRDYIR